MRRILSISMLILLLLTGLNLDEINTVVLNKTVTLHLPKVLGGMVTPEHIAQLSVNDSIIYSEFK